MNKHEAIELLRDHSKWLAESWTMTLEWRDYIQKFDKAIDVLATKSIVDALSWVSVDRDLTWKLLEHEVPISSRSSLHVTEDRYVVEGREYRVFWRIGDTIPDEIFIKE